MMLYNYLNSDNFPICLGSKFVYTRTNHAIFSNFEYLNSDIFETK